MARLFVEALAVRRDKTVAKALEARSRELLPEARRLEILVRILYEHGGGIRPAGEVVPPQI